MYMFFVYTPHQNFHEGKDFVLFTLISPDPKTLTSSLGTKQVGVE